MGGSLDDDEFRYSSGNRLTQALSPASEWILLTGNRHLVTVGVLLGVLLVLGTFLGTGLVDVSNEDSLTRLFSALVGANVTLITVVITINQLILSREFSAPDESREQIDEVMEFRYDVEAMTDASVSPVTPDEFLRYLVSQLHDHAVTLGNEATETVGNEATETTDIQHREEIMQYVDTVVDRSDEVRSTLDEQPSGSFRRLITVLNADFSSDVYAAQQLSTLAGAALSETGQNALEDICDLLRHVGVARQYYKTLYLQRELAALSRRIVIVGLPAVVASLLVVWLYGHPTGAVLDSQALAVVVLLSTLVALTPLVVLFSYVLRITTVARRTPSVMPFKIPE